MNPKISWRSGLALSVLLVFVALTACGYKTTTYSLAPTAVALARYNANGTPDTTNLVGGTGLVTTDVNTSQDDIAFAVVRQPADGKIIAVGTSFTTPASVVVIRYNVDGTRDSTFGSNGITVTSLPSADASAFAATLQADGKLLVAGRSCPLSGVSSFLLLRYNTAGAPGTAGTLDASFGTGGIVTTPIPSGSSTTANAVAVSGTNILVAGHSKIAQYEELVQATVPHAPRDPVALFPAVSEGEERHALAGAKLAFYQLLVTAGQLLAALGGSLIAIGVLRVWMRAPRAPVDSPVPN